MMPKSSFVRLVTEVGASKYRARAVNMVLLPFVAVVLASMIGLLIFGAVHLIVGGTSSAQGF